MLPAYPLIIEVVGITADDWGHEADMLDGGIMHNSLSWCLFQYSVFDENLYNAVHLVVQAASQPSGFSPQVFAQNLSMDGLNGALSMDAQGKMAHSFSLWDYHSDCNCFVLALELNGDSLTLKSSIIWPEGHPPSPDQVPTKNCGGMYMIDYFAWRFLSVSVVRLASELTLWP